MDSRDTSEFNLVEDKVVLNKSPKYEDIFSIPLQETNGTTNNTGTIEIVTEDNESQESVEEKVREYLKKQHWWLQEYWKEKGIPNEQFSILTENGNIEIYNFSGTLSPEHLEELQRLIEIFAKAQDKYPFQRVKYILLDNIQKPNPNDTEKDMNGYGPTEEQAIKIYPSGQQLTPHRVAQASNFEGTLIHELSHCFSTELVNAWKKTVGWQPLETPKKLPNGLYQDFSVDQPERCITDYAKINPAEDLCESMVAAIKAPKTLDLERLMFIRQRILGNTLNDNLTISIDKKTGPQIELPKIEKPIHYKKIKSEDEIELL